MRVNFTLREKHKEWYCCVSFKGENGKRKERWVPLKIMVKEDRKKEAKKLVEELSAPGAFNLESVNATNQTLARLGLYLYDANWRIIHDGALVVSSPKLGRPPIYPQEHDMTPEQIKEAVLNIKRGKKIYFGDFMILWYNIHKEGLAPATVSTMRSHVFHSVGPWFNEHKVTLTGIQPEDIEAFYRERAQYVGSNTLRHYHGTIRSALQYAFKRGYIVNNIADRAEKPKKTIFKGNFYNEEQLKKLFEVSKKTNLEFAVYMGAYYGLRREEICGLKWDAVDFQYKTITIKHTVIETSNGKEYQLYLKDTTKNKSSFRTLPLSDQTVDMLLKMKTRQEKMKILFGNRYNHEFDDYIYVFENGDLVRPGWITACFKRLLEDNNMPHIRFHDLRHSCATLLRHQGVPMEDISKWLGHSNLLTTEQVYAHYDDMKKGGTLKALSSALDKTNEPDKDGNKEMS